LTLYKTLDGELLITLLNNRLSLTTLVKSVFFISFIGLTACSPEPTKAPVTELTEEAAEEAAEETVAETVADAAKEPAMAPTDETRDPNWRQQLTKPALMTFEAGKSYFWDMKTNKGDMRFRLFHETAPMHATSTIYLTEMGFYDNVIFHRVIPGFMAQGGDPTGTGSGDPGYRYDGEFAGDLTHDRRGLLSMANAGPGTDGSQFFITFLPVPFLDTKHTLFGELVSGMETLEALEALGSRSGATQERLVIITASIIEE
jgi:peptidyl-prolyl cis-trans isomerase B (cyclophilin B)